LRAEFYSSGAPSRLAAKSTRSTCYLQQPNPVGLVGRDSGLDDPVYLAYRCGGSAGFAAVLNHLRTGLPVSLAQRDVHTSTCNHAHFSWKQESVQFTSGPGKKTQAKKHLPACSGEKDAEGEGEATFL